MVSCASCGRENPDGFRFCGACGAELVEVTGDVRKTVTILFCDLVGFTGSSERIDPEAVRRTQKRYFEDARAAVVQHGGTVEKFIGDAVMAVFGIPQAHEDDALRAVRAAIGLRRAVQDLGLEARIGVNTGEVVAGTGDALVTGDAVNTASRLEHVAPPGEILIGEKTLRLCRDRVEVETLAPLSLKGKSDPVPAFRLVRIFEETSPVGTSALATPMVGRARELAVVQEALDRAVSDNRCHVVLVSGAAGIGKSRLAAEFAATVEDRASVWTGRCLSYGEGITYWPLREIFRQAGAEEALHRAMARTAREETFRQVRSYFEQRARTVPVALILDDLHWAEATLLDLIAHIRDLSRAPMLIVGLTRPDLLDAIPSWGEARSDTTLLQLEPLGVAESEQLLADRTENSLLGAEMRNRIVERAEGNPLFLEELLAMVAGDADLDAIESIPTTIQTVLVARLEQLSPDEGRVAALASVEGREFHREAVVELAPPPPRQEVAAHLASLVAARLVREAGSERDNEEDFEFRHQLIRDAAYHRLPKAERADLHERFAGWLERSHGDGEAELDEVAGYHLEQAFRFRTEIYPADERTFTIATRAAEHLSRAGERAFGRSDMSAAAGLLRRAAALLESGAAARTQILPELGAALSRSGEFAEAREVLEQAIKEAQEAGEVGTQALATAEKVLLMLMIDPEMGAAEARSEGERLVAELEGSGEDRALAKAWYLIGITDLYASHNSDMERALLASLDHAKRAGDQQQISNALQWLSVAIRAGPTPAPDAIAHLEHLRASMQTGSEAEAGLLVNLGVLTAMMGQIHEARRLIASGRAILGDLGMEVMRAVYAMELSITERTAGDPAIVESELREACEALERMGERDYLSTACAYLGRALADQGKDVEAETWAARSKELATPDDLPSQIGWRLVVARVLARRGEQQEAEALAREALAMAETTDDPIETGGALVDLAEVLHAGGEAPGEVRSCIERAVELFENKGAVAPAERARAWLAAVEAGSS